MMKKAQEALDKYAKEKGWKGYSREDLLRKRAKAKDEGVFNILNSQIVPLENPEKFDIPIIEVADVAGLKKLLDKKKARVVDGKKTFIKVWRTVGARSEQELEGRVEEFKGQPATELRLVKVGDQGYHLQINEPCCLTRSSKTGSSGYSVPVRAVSTNLRPPAKYEYILTHGKYR